MEASRNPKGGAINLNYYEQPSVVASFQGIRPLLRDELQPQQHDIEFEAADLAQLTGQLQLFQHDYLGIESKRLPNAPLRIPAKLFKIEEGVPLTKGSPLYKILFAAYIYRIKNGWRKWDFGPTRKTKNLDLVLSIREFLLQTGFIQVPRIAFSSSMPDSARKTLTSLAKAMHLQICDNATHATHVLRGPLHQYDAAEEEWFRTLEKKNNTVLVHWWYYPDSYDSWLPQTDQFADPEEAPEHHGAWYITSRWLQDSARFNELMNEEDYEETEDYDEDDENEDNDTVMSSTTATTTQHRPSTSDGVISAASLDPEPNAGSFSVESGAEAKVEPAAIVATEAPANVISTDIADSGAASASTSAATAAAGPSQAIVAPPIPVLNPDYQPCVRIRDIEKDRPQLGSRQRKNEFEPYSNGDITNISQYTATFIEFPPATVTSIASANIPGTTSASQDIPMKDVKQEDGEDMTLEARQGEQELEMALAKPYDDSHVPLPEWFNKAQVHPIEKVALPEYFQATGRKAERLAKEYRMYRDFMIDAYLKNPSYYLSISECKAELGIDLVTVVRIHSFLEQAGLINQQLDPRRRIFDPYIDSEPDAQVTVPGSQRDFDAGEAEIQFLRKLIHEEKPAQQKKTGWDVSIQSDTNPDTRTVFSCSTCGIDCSEVRYQSFKYKDFQVCPGCFLEGKFTANTWKGEFLRVEKSEPDDMDDDWAEEEMLRLLEAIDRYDDDWLAISEHVGSRTKEQCITQFLQLPITDAFLSAKLSDKELEELPFGAQPNPVMALIAFLSAHVNPGIGSSAARRAIKELMNSEEDKDAMELDEREDLSFSPEKIKQAVTGALESAVEQAKKLASYESEEIQHWTRLAVKTMVDKLVLKVQQYDEQENFLENELRELDKQTVSLVSSLEALTKQYPAAGVARAADEGVNSYSDGPPNTESPDAPMLDQPEVQIPPVSEELTETSSKQPQ